MTVLATNTKLPVGYAPNVMPMLETGIGAQAPVSAPTGVMPSQPATAAPTPYGLSAAERALSGAGASSMGILQGAGRGTFQDENRALEILRMGRGDVGQTLQGGTDVSREALDPFMGTGVDATQLQAAMSGAMGPEAQAEAMQAFQNSPYMDQVLANAERGIMRNQSALGGIGSGNTMDQLYQNAAGMFMNDYNNRFNQLGTLSDRGLSASTTHAGIGANMAGQEAGIASGLYSQGAGVPMQGGQTRANIATNMANVPLSVGSQVAGLRYGAGQDIAGAVSNTTSALADLTNQQGAGISDITGQTTTNVNSLIQAATAGDAAAKEQLATILANMSVQQGSNSAAVPAAQVMQTNTLGQIGSLASGIGGALDSYGAYAANRNAPQVQAGTVSGGARSVGPY